MSAKVEKPPAQPQPTLTEAQVDNLLQIEQDVQVKAAQLGFLRGEYHSNLSRVLDHYEPLLAPLRVLLFAGGERQRLVELQILWLERLVALQERRGGTLRLPLSELHALEAELLRPATSALELCYQSLRATAPAELCALREWMCPPPAALRTMATALAVRGEAETDWPAAQVVLTSSYFFPFFVRRAQSLLRQPLPDGVMEGLEQYCAMPEHAGGVLRAVSPPLAAIADWLRAVRDYYRVRRLAQTFGAEVHLDARRQALTRLRHDLQATKENMHSAAERMAELREESAKRVAAVRNEYDDTMCALHEALEKETKVFGKVLGGEEEEEEEKEEKEEEGEEKHNATRGEETRKEGE